MNVTVPDQCLRGVEMSPADALRDLAIGLYVDERATLGQAAGIAGMSQSDFLHVLGSHQIPIHYDVQDFEADLATMDTLGLR